MKKAAGQDCTIDWRELKGRAACCMVLFYSWGELVAHQVMFSWHSCGNKECGSDSTPAVTKTWRDLENCWLERSVACLKANDDGTIRANGYQPHPVWTEISDTHWMDYFREKGSLLTKPGSSAIPVCKAEHGSSAELSASLSPSNDSKYFRINSNTLCHNKVRPLAWTR